MLEVKHLTKTYEGGKKSLRDVSFNANPGEVTAIIGPSGAGKTTLLRSVNQLITDDEGQILLDDQDIRALNRHDLKKTRSSIGMIFQNYNLIESLTTIENVLHGSLARKSTIAGVLSLYSKQEKQEALQLIDEVGLKDFAFKYCSDLSGGQKQRVGIARSLMQHPKMMLCDEPIASLDPRSTIMVMDILRKLADEKGLMVLINLHQVDIAKEYADHIIGLNDGQIVFDGQTKDASDRDIENIYINDEIVAKV
ncbi:MAG: phosphonate ABC transporter ATP-binding protein [Lentilactobacillus hilgardii]|uniref:phosphonate ABC transporter ATP-binding protein n=1 Tax=Lentilactobacillus hilgardii TaxID=1588 RepID=UPI001CC1F94C|nr:phosphonate ABC transporter ATP-binding protein [Lentilactobacillus hilgardii]MBZ2201735.1 phosphonate ABC transporter ATP-binding protein [Lentilactobacillus hilgardii]MBZ2204638.1 phosphonate ABC transporter ATP-binding protein [Lentilactobacillus hilgardii]